MPLTDEQIKEIAGKVVNSLSPQGGSAPEYGQESPEGEIVLLDEASREARIASRLILGFFRRAVEFDTKEEMEEYKKEHEVAPTTKLKVKPDSQKKNKEPREEPKEEPKEKLKEKPGAEISLDGVVDDPENWDTHSIDKSQLTPRVVIRFPGGESKKYGDLSDEEKGRVQTAISDGKFASKGLNDYSDRSLKTLKSNIQRNLARYDEGTDHVEKKITTNDPITEDNAIRVYVDIQDNISRLLSKYHSAIPYESDSRMRDYAKNVASATLEASRDGSLGDVGAADIDEFIREDVKRMIHQEIETRRRSLGDHGIRHIVGNMASTTTMLDQLQKSGIKVTGKDKLMAFAIQASHDLGYTSGDIATDIKSSGQHKKHSEVLMREEMDRYEKVFGKDDTEKMAHIVGTHDSNDFDWEKEPVASSVRLADNTALFGKDKVQDLFIRSPEAMGLACKLRLAAEADPENTELQDGIKKQMHGVIDKGRFADEDKEMLHRQVDEMSEGKFSTTVDILSRFSGKIEGFKYDSDSKVMDVNMAYSPEGQTVDMLFGDKIAGRQFQKFTEDMGGEPVEGNRGNVEFQSNGKPAFRLNMDGMDYDPIDSATTAQMYDFAEKTARMEIMKARSEILPPPEMVKENVNEALKYMEKSKSKFTPEEWKEMEKMFKELENEPDQIVERLAHWPLLQFERAYLEGKVAHVVERIVASLGFGDIRASFSRRGIVFSRRFAMGDGDASHRDTTRKVGFDFRKDVICLIRATSIDGRLGVWQHRRLTDGHYIAVLFVPKSDVYGEIAGALRDMGVQIEGV
jgi:hypothetical protein